MTGAATSCDFQRSVNFSSASPFLSVSHFCPNYEKKVLYQLLLNVNQRQRFIFDEGTETTESDPGLHD